jgi:DNA mismatch repair ATPase MutS
VGKFYEAAGIDAILLAEHLGLALMSDRVPRAGLAEINLHRSLRFLVREKGFAVVS